jgi:flagellar motor switch protein FliN
MALDGRLPTAALPPFTAEKRPGAKPLFTLDALGDVPLRLEAPLGCVDTDVRGILSLQAGSVLMLDRLTGESVPVTANGTAIAKGEVRVHGERFAVRITEILGRTSRARPEGTAPHARSANSP